MKKLFIAFLAVMLCTGAAWATDVELTGSYSVRGSYMSNDDALSADDTPSYMYYDQDFNLTTKYVVNDATFVSMRAAFVDYDWGEERNMSSDDNIAIERLWGGHTFGNGGKLELGLMTGAAWATAFGDNSGGKYRVKYTHTMGDASIFAILEKNKEMGSNNVDVEDAEDDDNDAYYLAGVFKTGDLTISPLLGYVSIGDVDDGDWISTGAGDDGDGDGSMIVLDLGVDGSFGSIGFESEFIYKSISEDLEAVDMDDVALFGFYANGWMNYGAGKVGLALAYGSWDDDEDVGFGMGEDFGDTIILGSSWTGFGGSPALTEFYGSTLFWLYGDYAVSEALNLNGRFAYGMSNADDGFWKDSTFWEFDAGFSYKISDAVTYSGALGYAQINLDEDQAGYDDADAALRVYHKFAIAF